MTRRALSTEKDSFSSINYISTKFPSIKDFSSSLNLEIYLKAYTIEMRLRTLKAFIRFLSS